MQRRNQRRNQSRNQSGKMRKEENEDCITRLRIYQLKI